MVRFETTHYELVHGKPPRGKGTWAFKITAILGYMIDLDQIYHELGTLTEAKRKMEARLKRLYPKATYIVTRVMP